MPGMTLQKQSYDRRRRPTCRLVRRLVALFIETNRTEIG
jgi:hypothetical protein